MFVSLLRINKVNIVFVLRHRFEKKQNLSFYLWKDWRLGVFFKKTKIVGIKNIKPKDWHKGLVNSFMIGMDLLIVKFWIEFDINGFRINEK